MVKMKKTDIPEIRKMLVTQQHGICPICGGNLTRCLPRNVVIDHDHRTGIVRAALHRGCNKVEGSILYTIRHWGKAGTTTAVIQTLERLLAFWKLHSKPQTEWIYYGYKTEAEKRIALNKKRRKATKNKRSKNG